MHTLAENWKNVDHKGDNYAIIIDRVEPDTNIFDASLKELKMCEITENHPDKSITKLSLKTVVSDEEKCVKN